MVWGMSLWWPEKIEVNVEMRIMSSELMRTELITHG